MTPGLTGYQVLEPVTLSDDVFGPVGLVQAAVESVTAAKRIARTRRAARIVGLRAEECCGEEAFFLYTT